MKPAHLIYLFTLVYFSLLTSCTGPVDDSSDENEQNDSTTTGAINFGKAQPANAGPNGIVMHEVLNTKYGIVGEYIPLPGYWQITQDAWQAPNDIIVKAQFGGSFTGQQRYVESIDQIIQQDLLPKLQQQGHTYLGTIDLPKVSQRDQQMYAMYWKVMPSQEHHAAKGIEFKDDQGNRGLIVVHFTLSQSQYGSFANYYMQELHAPQAHYKRAEKDLLYALANYKVNPKVIALHNQSEQQKSQVRWSAHNARMRNNQRSFESWQQSQQSLAEVNDIYFGGWKKRNAISDRMHEKTIDGIHEQQNINSPYGGEQYKVESGYKYYYMNQFGEYIGTNDEFYDPATDPNYNNLEWRKVNGG